MVRIRLPSWLLNARCRSPGSEAATFSFSRFRRTRRRHHRPATFGLRGDLVAALFLPSRHRTNPSRDLKLGKIEGNLISALQMKHVGELRKPQISKPPRFSLT